MEPQAVDEKVLIDEKSPTLTHGSRMPPPRRSNTPLKVGVVILIILLIIGIIVFFLFIRTDTKGDKSGQKKDGSAKTSPLAAPSLYQMVTLDLKDHIASLSAIDNDIKVIDLIFRDKSVLFSDILTPTPAQTPEWLAQKTEIAKARAELELVRRTATFRKLIQNINSTKKLNPFQKSQLINDINSYISFLSSLRETIAKQTDFQSLIGNINTLQDSYKSFAVIVPKVYIVVTADKINVLGDEFTKTANKLIQKTEKLRASKKDVTSVQKKLGNMLFMMGDATNQAEIAVLRVFPLTIEEYPKNSSILLDARSRLAGSSKNLRLAVAEAKKTSSSLETIETGKAPPFNLFQFFFPQ